MKKFLTAGICALFVAACGDTGGDSDDNANLNSGIDQSEFNAEVRPQDDFFDYINGKWIAETEIPGDQGSYGSFNILRDKSEANQREIIEELAATDHEQGTDQQRVGDFYTAFLNTDLVEEKGIAPLAGELAKLQAITDVAGVVDSMAQFQKYGINVPLAVAIFPDLKDSTQYKSYLFQGGLTLPNRDYYLEDSEKFAAIRDKFPGYVAGLLTLAGISDAAAKAQAVMDIEMRIAEHHWTSVENRNVTKLYNNYAVGDLDQVGSNFGWPAYLEASGLGDVDAVVVAQPSYFQALNEMLVDVSVDDWKTYLTFRLLHSAAPYLPADFVDARFAFQGKLVGGLEEQPARWKRGVRGVNGAMGEAVGRVYVEKYFPPEAKDRMEGLVVNLLEAFRLGITRLDWMGAETQAQAENKRSKFTTKIGYPDQWRDYSAMTIASDDLFGNIIRASEFAYWRNVNKLGKPIDKSEWGMTPQTVNASYNPTQNEITFPAAILQPPFFDLTAEDALNYGAIGAVIGHEISHGFDDQGRKFDGDGNLRDWWTAEDNEKFTERASALVAQYNEFQALPDMTVNGELTLGENIGDLSGLAVSYRAYQLSLNGEEAPVIDGLTGDQRFFIGWALAWRAKAREQAIRARLVADPHSPPKYRANGILRNMPEFYAAFGVREGDGMYLAEEDRVKIW